MTIAGLTIGGWFAVAVIANFVGKMRSVLEERSEQHNDDAKMLIKVKDSLDLIKAVFDVAEHRPVENPYITNWLLKIKEIVSEVADLLDDLEIRRIQDGLQNKMSGLLVYLMKKQVSDADMKRMKSLLSRLDDVTSRAGGFSDLLKSDDNEKATRSFLSEIQPVFHGRDEEKEQLMSFIFPNVREDANVRVVCIVGEAGVGKTALAQVIYNHPNVKEAFNQRGWVFLPHKFDSECLTKNIVCSFAAEQHTFNSELDLEPLQASSYSSEELSIIIHNKRFFLVLDNAKGDNLQRTWRTLSAKLSGGAAGSIVLVTTRSESAKIAGSSVVILGAMPTDIFSTIFNHHAFGNHRKDSLEPIGQEIAGRLHGLPLLAEVVGRVLRMKLNERHWRNVSENEWWHNYDDLPSTNPALPSVTVALEFLGDHLKNCLAYCSMFPSSCLFDKNILVHMWMSSSIQQEDEFVHNAREIRWFDHLFNRALIQPTVWKNKYTVNKVIRKIMSIMSKINQTGCCTIDDRRTENKLDGFSHIAIAKRDFNVLLGLSEHRNVRSLLFFDGQATTKLHTALVSILPKSSSLRVLDLSCIGTTMVSPPDAISTCLYLRYLDLSFTGITIFPDSFCKLYLLEVLRMRGCRFHELPRAMNELVNLRYLYAEACTLSLIHSIGKLTNLKRLEEFAANTMEGHRITELKDLNNLGGHLCISNLDKVTSMTEVTAAKLHDKKYIQKLVLKWNEESATPNDCMRTLSQLRPNGYLKNLEIQCYMGVEFPGWIAQDQHFTKLRYIKFSDCQSLVQLPPLGELSHLKILILQGLEQIKSIGEEFYGIHNKVFLSLEELTFCDMTNWERWMDIEVSQTIPHIKKVAIKNCKRLSDVPRSVFKGSLKDLEFSDCGQIFRRKPNFLEELKELKRLKIHSCLGTTVYLPSHLLASLEVLNLQNCQVCYQGGQEYIARLRRFLTIDCHEVTEEERREVTSNPQSSFSYSDEDLRS